ncbi:MAG: DUF2304 domain-containing protein [Actinobacteria bacterium]|nr:DUF2304 domain-containing protein [Actinomycetota bacterium]
MILATNQISSFLGQRLEVIIFGVLVCLVIFELVRRKHLMERYALLWLAAGVILLVLALWRGLLTTFSHAVGIYYPPAALFGLGFLFVLILLIHFSIAISRLSDQNKILAQRLALLQQRLEKDEGGQPDRERSEDEPVEGESTPSVSRGRG